ncbi:MAG TPA: hypothetical protein VMV59_01400 [Candidatus Dormibacteraeota bacterium]|nr:hypothetical protein [Candidatus Dormibacteraeota bacterium]
MTATFDIFEVEPDGSVMWRGSAAAFEEAKAFVEKMGTPRSGDFIIFSLKTGKKVVIKPDGSTTEQEAGQT